MKCFSFISLRQSYTGLYILCGVIIIICVSGGQQIIRGQSLDERLDQESFVEGLSDYGFDDVLGFMQDSYDNGVTDPALVYLIRIGRARLAVMRWSYENDGVGSEISKGDLIERLLEARRDLLSSFPDDYRLSKWQGDLAFDLLFTAGAEAGLDLTVEFGIASDREKELLSGYAVEAANLADQAINGVEDWIIELEDSEDFSRNVDKQQKRRNLVNIEKNQRLPFLWGAARYLAIVTQSELELKDEIVLREVVSTLGSLALELDEPWLSRAKVTVLLARVHLNDFAESNLIEQLKDFADDDTLEQATRFRAVAGAVLASGKTGDPLAALNSIDEFKEETWINSDPYWSLLITDQQYKWRLGAAKAGGLIISSDDDEADDGVTVNAAAEAESDNRDFDNEDNGLQAFNWACGAYESYISNADLPLTEAQRSDIVFNRLARIMPEGFSGEQMPPLMIMADAQRAIADAGTLNHGIMLLENLLPREELSDALKARLLYMLSAVYIEDGRYVDAVTSLLKLANDYPLDHRAPFAAGQAVRLALQVYENTGTPTVDNKVAADVIPAEELLEQAFDTLIERYPSHVDFDWTALQRGDYETESGRFDKAIEAYSLILSGSEIYVQAKYNIIAALFKQAGISSAKAETKENLSEVIDEAQRVLEVYRRIQAKESGRRDGPGSEVLSHYISLVELVKVQAYMLMNEPEPALAVVESVLETNEIKNDDGLIIQFVDLQIRVLDVLGRYEEIGTVLNGLVEQYPDKVSVLLDTLIENTYQRIKTIEMKTGIDKEVSEAQQQLLPLLEIRIQINAADDIIVKNVKTGFYIADSYRMAGDYNQAQHYFDKISDSDIPQVEIVSGKAECLYHLKEYSKAIKLYQQLISGGQESGSVYWQAELRQLQILDIVLRNTDRIYPRIQRLRMYDRELGGTRYSGAFSVLEHKYAP